MSHAPQQDIPDTILPSQYFSRSRIDTPEERLLFAMLVDAVKIVTTPVKTTILPDRPIEGKEQRWSDDKWKARTGNQQRKDLLSEALNWFASDDAYDIFCFRSVCDVLGLDAEAIRDGLKRASQPAKVRWQMNGSQNHIGEGTKFYRSVERRKHRRKQA